MGAGWASDRDQLIPLIKAGLKHKGFAMIDVISPCVTFNDHEGSTKSYAHTRKYYHPAIHTDYIEPKQEIRAAYDEGEVMPIALHDGSKLLLRKTDKGYAPDNRVKALEFLEDHREKGEIVTGLLYVEEDGRDFHGLNKTIQSPLTATAAVLDAKTILEQVQARFR